MSRRTTRSAVADTSADDAHLRRLGYDQKLDRRLSPFSNMGSSFTVISILSGCMTMFLFGMNTGGPAVMWWGWLAVGVMVLLLAMSLAEVTSAYPQSGALFYMAHQLGGKKWGYFTGWLNLLGLIGAVCAIDYGCAQFIGAFVSLQWGASPDTVGTYLIFAGILLVHALLNARGIRLMNVLNQISVWWHVGGVALIVGWLYLAPVDHRGPEFVFTEYFNNTGFDNPLYVTALGLLMAQYTFCGYDASAHMTEETKNPSVSAPRGMVQAVLLSLVVGAVLLYGLLSSIQDYDGTLNSATGVPPAQIFLDVVGTSNAKLLLLVVIVAQLFCGYAEVAASSRMAFAFSRDNALPFSKVWFNSHPRTKAPVQAVWLSVGAAAVLALPSLYSPTAYTAITAVNVLGITPAYAIPVLLRMRKGKEFVRGPWNLGKWSAPINALALVWVAFVTVLFMLPTTNPVTASTFNYAGVVFVGVFLFATLMWVIRKDKYSVPNATILGSAETQSALSRQVS